MKIFAPAFAAALLAATFFISHVGGQSRAKPPANPQRANPSAAHSSAHEEAARLNNLGVAYMNRQEPARALGEFQQASVLDPRFESALLNQGVALLNLQRYAPARKILSEAAGRNPKNPRAWYNLGLLEKTQGNPQAAIADFSRVAALDPDDADTQYMLGTLYAELQQYEQAKSAFEKTIALNPFHVSAEFGLAQADERSGNSDAARLHLARFQHLTAEKLGAPMEVVYGAQGKYSLAEQTSSQLSAVPPAIPVHFEDVTAAAGLFTSPQEDRNVNRDAQAGGACVFDFDGDGKPDVFLTIGHEVPEEGVYETTLYHNDGNGRFKDVTRGSGLEFPFAAIGCAAGDYDNDGRLDLALSVPGAIADGLNKDGSTWSQSSPGALALFHNEGDNVFKYVGRENGGFARCPALGLTFVDYDHDGDLDLYVNCASASRLAGGYPGPEWHNILLRNNGNGTFTDWTEQTGLAGNSPTTGALATDINNDRAIDFVLLSPDHAPEIYLNPREGKFAPASLFPADMPASSVGAAVLDFDKDGWMDLAFTHANAPALTLWRNLAGKKFERVPLPDLGWSRAWGVAALDYDNDGWVDLVAVGEGADGAGKIALLRNEGAAGFRDVTHETGLDKIKLVNPRAVIPFDYDGDGAIDLLVTQVGAPPVLLRNVGGNRNNWIDLALTGEHDNKSAIGTKVEVYAGALTQKFEVGAAGYLGQSVTNLHIGLGAAKSADVVRLLWPTGVLQDEVNLPARKTHPILELDRRGSSCPIVFAWNGKKFEFLADMIGPGIVGHWIGPNQRNLPDPDEYLKVAGESLRPRNGRLSLRMIEPMEELDYLDQVRLLAVDHPSDAEVWPNEYFASNPPFPEFKVIASRGAHLPAGAWDDRGRDVLPLLRERDRRYVEDFPGAPYQGFAAMHSLELDLGPWDSSRPLRLLMDGFTDYFTANSMYAAWQAGITPVAPYVEALGADGKWNRVVDDMGFPAGLARTMVADLTGKLPAGTRRIRITTNLKIYWDRIRIDNSPAGIPYRVSEAGLMRANLAFRGYPRVVEGQPKNDITYVYEDVSSTGPYARQTGNYTRYGDVTSIVAKADDEYVIFGSGDEVAVEFDAANLPPVPAGWKRDYFFYANGFAKDMDFYAAHGDTVEPLPWHADVPYPYPPGKEYPADAEHLAYELRYNTRPVSGVPPVSYRPRFRHPAP